MNDLIINFLKIAVPDLKAIRLFGSVNTKMFSPSESDIDIAFLSDRKFTESETWEMSQELAKKLKTNVDLVNMNTVSTVFCYEIIKTGKLIYAADKTTIDFFENKIMGEYLKLNDERKEILQDISEKGIF